MVIWSTIPRGLDVILQYTGLNLSIGQPSGVVGGTFAILVCIKFVR